MMNSTGRKMAYRGRKWIFWYVLMVNIIYLVRPYSARQLQGREEQRQDGFASFSIHMLITSKQKKMTARIAWKMMKRKKKE